MFRKKNRLIMLLIFIFLLSFASLDAQDTAQLKPEQAQDPGLIDLDVKDVDIREIARIFSRISGLSVIVSDDVVAKVTFKGTKINWEKALEVILKTYNLTYVREGNFLRILTYARLRQEEEGIPLVTKVVFLNFAKAYGMLENLASSRSSRGRITADVQTNSLVITDTPAAIAQMLGIIKDLDKRTPQVMIEAMMVDVKLTSDEQLGINWTMTHKDVSSRSISQALSSGRTEGIIRYGKTILPYASLSLLIDFWCENQKAEVLANPKVLTLDGLPAKIELGEEIPYTQSTVASTTGAVTSTVSFRTAGIKLDVIPHISSGGFISLDIKTEQSFRTGTINGQPIVDSRKAETNLLAADGETIVIGGLKKKSSTFTVDKFPLLGDLPFFGKLFQKRVTNVVDSELLIFVTPYIVSDTQLSAVEKDALDKFKETPEREAGPEEKKKAPDLLSRAPFPLRAP